MRAGLDVQVRFCGAYKVSLTTVTLPLGHFAVTLLNCSRASALGKGTNTFVAFMRRTLMHLIGAPAQSQGVKARGVLHQAFAAAIVQHELREFYRLMAMLQSLVMRPVPVNGEDNGYLTLRRLATWLRDATRRMCILVELAEQCHGKKVRLHQAQCVRTASYLDDRAQQGQLVKLGPCNMRPPSNGAKDNSICLQYRVGSWQQYSSTTRRAARLLCKSTRHVCCAVCVSRSPP